jgi:HprK-related kinase A
VKVAAFSPAELRTRLSSCGIWLRTGPFIIHVQSSIPSVADGIALLYADYPIDDDTGFADFHVAVSRPANLRRWFRPQAVFSFDGRAAFPAMPLAQTYPMFEWGLNWCIYSHANQYLIFHAAVVEKGGRAAIMPGEPGIGKSTLCAALVNRGWRLLSDELALISLGDVKVTPITRPISLKNASIDVIRAFAPDAVIGQVTHDTAKGAVAHMRPPADSVERSQDRAIAGWLIFPRYVANIPVKLESESKARAFMRIAKAGFNYSALGVAAFETLAALVDSCHCYDLAYGDLDQAIAAFDTMGSQTELAPMGVPA